MSYKATKPGLVSVLYLSMRYMQLWLQGQGQGINLEVLGL